MDLINQIVGVYQTFGVTWPSLGAAVLNFAIVLFVLNKFAVKPFQAMLEKRKNIIAEAMKNAESVEAQLKSANEEKARIINAANISSATIIDSAKANANTVKDRIISEASSDAINIKTKAQETSILERDKLMKSAKAEIANLVMGVTENIIGRTLTADDQSRIAKEASTKIAG